MRSPARLWFFVLAVYLTAACFSVTIKRFQPEPQDLTFRYRQHAYGVLSTPRVLRGEEPHFLMMAHSLAHDGDLRLSREYISSMKGGPERGVYWAKRPAEYFLMHFTRKPDFSLVGTHPVGLSAVLAAILWPLAGTPWMEAGAIWVTALVGSLGVLTFIRLLEAFGFSWQATRSAALCLAFATPWFAYSRTLYTEVYLGFAYLLVMLAMARGRWWVSLLVCVVAAWIKYPALLLFASVGTTAAVIPVLRRRLGGDWPMEPRRPLGVFFGYATVGALTLLLIFAFNQKMYGDAGWVTTNQDPDSSHSIARAGAPIAWVPGKVLNNIERLFTDFDKGLFPHTPLLIPALAGLIVMVRRTNLRPYACLLLVGIIPFSAIHITYRHLMTGESYTTRYLVPMIPLAMAALPPFWHWAKKKPVWRFVGIITLALSLINNLIAGFFPGLSFNKTPWEIWHRFGLLVQSAFMSVSSLH